METAGGKQLLDYWLVIHRRRWVILLAVATVGLVALAGSFLVTPLYRGTVTLQIERQNPDVLNMQDIARVDYSWGAYSDFYQTQYKIIASREVARLAVERLGLLDHPAFDPAGAAAPGLIARLTALLPRRGVAREMDPVDAAAARVLSQLEVAPVRNSQLVRLSWVSSEPDLAADVANAMADAYIALNLHSRYSTTDQARRFLIDQIGTLKTEITAIEERLQAYGESKGIVSIDDTHNVTLQALKDIAQERTEAQTALARAEARYSSVAATPAEGLPEVMNSPLITQLRQEYAGYEAEFTEKSKLFKEGWPSLQTLQSKMEQARLRIELETTGIAGQVVASAKSEYSKARSTFDNLDQLLREHGDDAQRLKRDAGEYANLQSEVTKKRETLAALLQRQNEMSLSTRLKDLDATSSNIRIMEPARPPAAPFRPRTGLNLLLGVTFGLALGVGMALILDYLDNTITTVSGLEKILSISVLAAIPRHGAPAPAPRTRASRKQAPVAAALDLIPYADPGTSVAEAYRDLRTSILLSHAGQPPRLLMVTSALPSEGKTTTALNLAVVLAQLGRRVLLVDTDLRRPRLHAALRIANRRGVSTYLSGMHAQAADLIARTTIENLDLMPSGPIPPNPSELLNSEIFAQMGREMIESGYDHVVFDSPPMLSVSDPMILASVVDMAILVVGCGSTPRQSVRIAAEKLGQARHGLAGAVLNGVELDRAGYYHYPIRPIDEPSDEGRDDAEKRASGAASS